MAQLEVPNNFGEDGIANDACAPHNLKDAERSSYPKFSVSPNNKLDNVRSRLQQMKRQTDSSISDGDQLYLAEILQWTETTLTGNHTIRSVETGLANGGSALAIVASALASNAPLRHTAFDPYQK